VCRLRRLQSRHPRIRASGGEGLGLHQRLAGRFVHRRQFPALYPTGDYCARSRRAIEGSSPKQTPLFGLIAPTPATQPLETTACATDCGDQRRSAGTLRSPSPRISCCATSEAGEAKGITAFIVRPMRRHNSSTITGRSHADDHAEETQDGAATADPACEGRGSVAATLRAENHPAAAASAARRRIAFRRRSICEGARRVRRPLAKKRDPLPAGRALRNMRCCATTSSHRVARWTAEPAGDQRTWLSICNFPRKPAGLRSGGRPCRCTAAML